MCILADVGRGEGGWAGGPCVRRGGSADASCRSLVPVKGLARHRGVRSLTDHHTLQAPEPSAELPLPDLHNVILKGGADTHSICPVLHLRQHGLLQGTCVADALNRATGLVPTPCTHHPACGQEALTPGCDSACNPWSRWRSSQTSAVSSNTFLRRASFSARF